MPLTMQARRVLAACLAVAILAVAAGDAQGLSGRTVSLGHGKIGNHPWEVRLTRIEGRAGAGRKGRLRPCVSVGVSGFHEGPLEPSGSNLSLCVASPSLTADDLPLIVEGGEPTPKRGIEAKATVVGIAFAPGVSRVELTNFDGSVKMLDLQRLSRAQARRVRLARLGYVVFAVAGAYCVDRLVSYAADDDELYDSGSPGRCPPQEFPHRQPG